MKNYFKNAPLLRTEMLGIEIRWRIRKIGTLQAEINTMPRPVYYTDATRKRENLVAIRNAEINSLLQILEKEFSFVHLPYMRYAQEDIKHFSCFMKAFVPTWNGMLERKREIDGFAAARS